MSVRSATESLIEEFRSRPTLRAGSLITTVFGDAIAPRGGSVWIGSLIDVMAGFGIKSSEQVRTLAPHCDAVVVGSAIVRAVAKADEAGKSVRTAASDTVSMLLS